jgi:hypothetical protein
MRTASLAIALATLALLGAAHAADPPRPVPAHKQQSSDGVKSSEAGKSKDAGKAKGGKAGKPQRALVPET